MGVTSLKGAGPRGGGQPGAGIFKAWERATRMPPLHISHAQPPLAPAAQKPPLITSLRAAISTTLIRGYRSEHRGQYFSSLGTDRWHWPGYCRWARTSTRHRNDSNGMFLDDSQYRETVYALPLCSIRSARNRPLTDDDTIGMKCQTAYDFNVHDIIVGTVESFWCLIYHKCILKVMW